LEEKSKSHGLPTVRIFTETNVPSDQVDQVVREIAQEESGTLYKAMVCIEGDSNRESLQRLFNKGHWEITDCNDAEPKVGYVTLIILLKHVDDDYLDIWKSKFTKSPTLLFTIGEQDINVFGWYVFVNTNSEDIVEKFEKFLINRKEDFNIKKLSDHFGVSRTNGISEYFTLEWRP